MKMKFLLGAIVALVVSQSMQALEVVFVNNFSAQVRVGLDTNEVRKGPWTTANNFDAILKPFRGAKLFNCPEDEEISTITIGYSAPGYRWGLLGQDLEQYNIPLSGDHKLVIHILDGSGRMALMVDGDRKVFIQAELLSNTNIPEGV